jgi:hypothetical protein
MPPGLFPTSCNSNDVDQASLAGPQQVRGSSTEAPSLAIPGQEFEQRCGSGARSIARGIATVLMVLAGASRLVGGRIRSPRAIRDLGKLETFQSPRLCSAHDLGLDSVFDDRSHLSPRRPPAIVVHELALAVGTNDASKALTDLQRVIRSDWEPALVSSSEDE